MNRNFKLVCCFIAVASVAPAALAHKFSTAYMDVKLSNDQPILLWKVALHDLAQARLISAENSHQVSWQQVMDSAPVLNRYLTEQVAFKSAGTPCTITPAVAADWQLQQIKRDLYVVLPITVSCNSSSNWQLTYRALFASEPSHKLLLSWQVPATASNQVLTADADTYPVN